MQILLAQHGNPQLQPGKQLARVQHANPRADTQRSTLVRRSSRANVVAVVVRRRRRHVGIISTIGIVWLAHFQVIFCRIWCCLAYSKRCICVDVFKVIGLDVVCEMEDDGKGDGEQGGDEDGDAGEDVGKGEVGGWLERSGLDASEDPVDDLIEWVRVWLAGCNL